MKVFFGTRPSWAWFTSKSCGSSSYRLSRPTVPWKKKTTSTWRTPFCSFIEKPCLVGSLSSSIRSLAFWMPRNIFLSFYSIQMLTRILAYSLRFLLRTCPPSSDLCCSKGSFLSSPLPASMLYLSMSDFYRLRPRWPSFEESGPGVRVFLKLSRLSRSLRS